GSGGLRRPHGGERVNGLIVRALILFGCLAATSAVMAGARSAEPAVVRMSFDQFPMTLGSWRAVQDPPMEPEILQVLGVDDYLSRAYYRPDGQGVGLYAGFYKSQRQGDTIHSPLNCLPGAGWEPLSQTRLSIDLAGAKAPALHRTAPALHLEGDGFSRRRIEVNRYVVQKGLERQLVLYWYQSHGRVVASEYTSRLLLIHDAIRLNRTDGSLVRVIAPIPVGAEDGGASAEALAVRFVRVLVPALSGYLPS
ncbi:MAG: exosortase C-terminal domain/associated protein EpsI, partial [Vicinamibacterales bacterium]